MWYVYTMEHYSAIKKNEIMLFAGKWMELKSIMLSEINQSQVHYVFSPVWDLGWGRRKWKPKGDYWGCGKGN
jgi:hypothetical protein